MKNPYLISNVNEILTILTNNINKLIDYKNMKLNELSYEMIDKLIYEHEKISLSFRQALEEKETPKDLFRNGMLIRLNPDNHKDNVYSFQNKKNLGIKVWEKNNGLFIKTPFTFKRINNNKNVKENYQLVQYIEKELKKWLKYNDISFLEGNDKLIFIIKRITLNSNIYSICDNDNMENGRIVNMIFDCLQKSDNFLEMNLCSCVNITDSIENTGMVFIVTKNENFKKNIEFFFG